MAFDLIIRGGTVYDGTGAAARVADVAINDGLIADVGKIDGRGRREINADGAMVTPGFVDIHTHYDGLATWSSRLQPSSHHGVTTVVMGNCGVGFAPVRPRDQDRLIELMEGIEDIPGTALHEGLPWAWESFPDYLDYLSARSFDMDIGAQFPHAALRVYVMGERGANREPATAADIAEMRRLTTEAIAAGALGFSTSRTLNHRSVNGEPTPSLTAARDELLGIAAGIRDARRGVIELISDFKDLDQEFELVRAMLLESGAPMTISLADGINPQGWRPLLAMIDGANADGLAVKGQVAPRAIGIMLGLTATLNPFIRYPHFDEIRDLPLAEKVARLQDPEFRARLLSSPSELKTLQKRFVDWERIWVLGDPPDYEPTPDASIAALAASEGRPPEQYALDAMLRKGGREMLYTPFANYRDNNLDCCREMILARNTVMGLGDGGAHVGTICDASFITTLLTHWGRDRTRGERIDLATLVKAQTQDTAAAVGLKDRGVLMPGLRADVNVIDFERLGVRAPEMVRDLPADGARLEQKADGYLATIVSGEVTYRHGEATEALPGRLIR
ncbi:MAG: amidohydrolase family protein [Proteobacteria bacterium]|nr:amidohydrolase family protein [Pseudomonadota bacterium]MDA1299061.1 amidohydrolase family protein [Pseudomonadota bacterium]